MPRVGSSAIAHQLISILTNVRLVIGDGVRRPVLCLLRYVTGGGCYVLSGFHHTTHVRGGSGTSSLVKNFTKVTLVLASDSLRGALTVQ